IPSLPRGECTDIRSGVAIDSHPLEGHRVRYGRYDQLSRVLERNESLVEQVVHRRGQEQTIFAIEALLIAAVSPGLNVARDQVLHALHTGDPACMLNRAHVVPEESLATTRHDECSSLGLRDCRIGIDISLDASLPFLDIALGRRRVALNPADPLTDIGDLLRLRTDQRKQRPSELPADLRQIHTLQTVAFGGQRCVFASQMSAQPRNVILGTDCVGETLPANAHSPADLAPVGAGEAKFLRLRAVSAIATDDAEGGDARIAE